MKISIIIPTYNEESTIERLMETLEPLNERCEILFVDGGSTDGTLAEEMKKKADELGVKEGVLIAEVVEGGSATFFCRSSIMAFLI